MKTRTTTGALAATLLAVGSTPAFSAGDLPACGEFGLVGGELTVFVDDIGETGDSPGDRRIGERALLDPDGTEVGTLRFVEHVLTVDGEVGTRTMSNKVLVLPGGTLHAVSYIVHAAATNPDGQPSGTSTWLVFGGTDQFEASSGKIIAEYGPDKTSTYNFMLTCD
jgi:hypothetical protein